MAKYIELEATVKRFNNFDAGRADSPPLTLLTPEEFAEYLYELPTADVAPVVHGRWDDSGRYTFPGGSTAVRCTNCGCALTEGEYRLYNWNYCPVCGAKMDGGADDASD